MRALIASTIIILVTACSHPLEPAGEGDIISASGDRDCLLEQYRAGDDNCTLNRVGGAYKETYYAQPRPGWKFDHWDNYCENVPGNECSFDIPAIAVKEYWGETLAPLRAVFVRDEAPQGNCDKVFSKNDIYIVDLSTDSETGGACGLLSGNDKIADCVATKIRNEFAESPACLGAFDVFVPGTNAEDGKTIQFTELLSSTPGRTYLSLQYSYESTLWKDTIQYDKGVRDADKALEQLLYALKNRFSEPDIRVFGHSKGSHAVVNVADNSAHSDVQFYAFAQPGATPSALRGRPGYIEKLADNLLVFTWQNDEVKYFTGGKTGYKFPDIWGFPGYINQEDGGQTLWPIRIDHHNNYGGDYTKKDHPYCATGNKTALVIRKECRNQEGVDYVPYFWGNTECTSIAHEMMNYGNVDDARYIGYSGPRAPGCKDTVSTVTATYALKYSMNIADQKDCKYSMNLSFEGRDSGTSRKDGGEITVSSTKDTYGVVKRGVIQLPYHMKLRLNASMADVSGKFSKCINYAGAKSEGYIHELAVNFRHPETGEQVNRTLIGNTEGIEYIWPLKMAGKNNVAWRKTSGGWDLHFGIAPAYPVDAIMVKGKTAGGQSGKFYKYLHLVD